MKIFVTRHSKTIWNQEQRLQGWLDSPLTREGIEDAKLLKRRLTAIPIDICYSSPLARAKNTSELLFDHVPIIFDERLKEMNFGEYEGRFVQDVLKKQDYYDLWHRPRKDLRLPSGESFQEVQDRLLSFLQDVYKKHSKETVFLTIHGMTFIILLGLIKQIPIADLHEINRVIRGCSLSCFTYDGERFSIDYIGDDTHLAPTTEIINYKK